MQVEIKEKQKKASDSLHSFCLLITVEVMKTGANNLLRGGYKMNS